MPKGNALSPLFTDVKLSADDAAAIAAALRDVAQVDGEHPDELAMIQSLVAELDADLGEGKPTALPAMTPEKLANLITDPDTRHVAIQVAVLLGWADGALSDKERARIVEYATALGFSRSSYDGIEKAITGWVKSGELAPLF
jgi:tellurite resistance protein